MESTNVYFDLSISDASSTSAPGLALDPLQNQSTNDCFLTDVAYFPDACPAFSRILFPHPSDPLCFPTNVAYFPDAYPAFSPIPFPHPSDPLCFPTDFPPLPPNSSIDAFPAIASPIPEPLFSNLSELDLLFNLSINEPTSTFPEFPQLPVHHVNNPLPVQDISVHDVQPVTTLPPVSYHSPNCQKSVAPPSQTVRKKQKHRTVEQRRKILQNDEFITVVQETWVLCGGCKQRIELDWRDGARYYPGFWFNHKVRCKGIPGEIRRRERERLNSKRRVRKAHHQKDPLAVSG